MVNEQFIRDRISKLRTQKGVSEYKMSLDLGHSKGYIQSITSGRAMPSMSEFLSICNYFEITPKDFFDEGDKYPFLVNRIKNSSLLISDDDLNILIPLVDRLSQNNDLSKK